jgi:hypothetical protein
VPKVDFVELELEEDATILARVERVGDDLHEDESPSDIGLREALSFSTVSSALRGVAADIHRAVQAVSPNVAEVEFGLEMAMQGSRLVCLLVEGDAKASLRVRLEWHKSNASVSRQ